MGVSRLGCRMRLLYGYFIPAILPVRTRAMLTVSMAGLKCCCCERYHYLNYAVAISRPLTSHPPRTEASAAFPPSAPAQQLCARAPASRASAPPPRPPPTCPRVRRSPPRRLTIPARTRRWRPRRAASVGRGLRAARGQTCGASVSSGGSRRTSSGCFGWSRRSSSRCFSFSW